MKNLNLFILLLITMTACKPIDNLNSLMTPSGASIGVTESSIPAISTETEKPRSINTSTQSIIPFLTPTETFAPTITQVIIVPFLEGIVNEQASCRYGAGAAYLFEWGLYPGDEVRILNRNSDGSWVYIKPITYNNECWVRVDLLDFKGNVNNLEEYYSPPPYVFTYLYKPVKYVKVNRIGTKVTINWDPVKMTEDDDRGYLIEAWVCQGGKYIFFASNYFPYTNTTANINDEPGCTEKSHARFYTVEKHGYMPFIEIPWPPY